MPNAKFSKIIIIQSLSVDNEFTGTKLRDDIEPLNIYHDLGLDIDLKNIDTKSELTDVFKSVEYETENDGLYPLLHFEIHGSDDTTGLILSSGDYVSWEELIEPLTKINIACRLNLLVILAVCYGANLTRIIKPTDRAPFWGLVGPTHKIKTGFILKAFYQFYKTLLKSENGASAVSALNNEKEIGKGYYRFSNAESFFKKVYIMYVQEECTPEKLEERARKMFRILKKEQGNSARSVGQLKRHLKKTQEESFYKYCNKFFMFGMYPENKERFNLEYKNISNLDSL